MWLWLCVVFTTLTCFAFFYKWGSPTLALALFAAMIFCRVMAELTHFLDVSGFWKHNNATESGETAPRKFPPVGNPLSDEQRTSLKRSLWTCLLCGSRWR
jgi:hypothetical protein